MKQRIFLLIIWIGGLVQSICAQELPKIIPPSPSTMQMQKYGDYPVGHFTGVPDISIPLYTIKEGDLELPISLKYHASGSKPSDADGYVGLGWSLYCGSTISRTIMDDPDEVRDLPNPFYTMTELNAMPRWQREELLWTLYDYDSEPDIFSYSIGSHQGKFAFKRDVQRTPLLFPYRPVKITPNTTSILYFDVVDDGGIQYKFVGNEWATGLNINAPSSWLLEKMTSAIEPSNTILFNYTTAPIEFSEKRAAMFVGDDDASTAWLDGSCYVGNKPIEDLMEFYYPQGNTANTTITYSGKVISEISFRTGKIKFLQNPTTKMLESIEVYNKSNNLLKAIGFVYVEKPAYRTLLKQVNFYDKNYVYVNRYSFDYTREENGNLPTAYTANIDYWGYYNGAAYLEVMPAWEVYFPAGGLRAIGNNTREANEMHMKTFVLETINYPTGGKTVFELEANKYQGGQILNYSGQDVGGLRVKSIKNYASADAVPEIKTYEYGYSGTASEGYGLMDLIPGRIEDYSFSQRFYIVEGGDFWTTFRRRYYYSEPFCNLSPHGSPVTYPTVAEYFGTGQNNTGKVLYEYDHTYIDEFANYQANLEVDGGWGSSVIYKKLLKPYKEWLSGNLLSKTYYKNNNGVYKEVSKEENVYEDVAGETLRGLYMERYVQYVEDGCPQNPTLGSLKAKDAVLDQLSLYPTHHSAYHYGDYFIESGERRLKKKITSGYDNSPLPSMTTEVEFEYQNNTHGQPVKKTTRTSKGENIITTYKYPHDFVATSPYNTMVDSRHIWNKVIEESNYINDLTSPVNAIRTNYSDWGNNVIAPVTVETKKGTGNYETRIRFHSYDNKGNMLSVSKEHNIKNSYVWGYDGTLPIAEVINAVSNEIAHTSFESGADGNWVIASGTRVTTDAMTGKLCYQLSNGNISKSGITPSSRNVLSYWSKNGVYTVGGGTAVVQTGPTVNGWTFHKHIVTASSNTVTISGNGLIDGLSFYPENAQMTTYTYDPLVGMTSQCDANNRITYYEYDAFGRLSLVRDQDRNVVRKMEYKYQ